MDIRLQNYLRHPAAQHAERRYSVGAATGELQHERDLLERYKDADGGAFDKNPAAGAIDVTSPGHGMSVPGRVQASWDGDSFRGTIRREEELFLDPKGERNLKTLTHTEFRPFGMTLTSATEGPDGVRVRQVQTDVSEAAWCYTDSFFIARDARS